MRVDSFALALPIRAVFKDDTFVLFLQSLLQSRACGTAFTAGHIGPSMTEDLRNDVRKQRADAHSYRINDGDPS